MDHKVDPWVDCVYKLLDLFKEWDGKLFQDEVLQI